MEKTRSLRYHLAPPYGTSCGRPVIGQLINLRRPLLLTNERARCLGLQREEDANLATTVKPNGLLIDSQSLWELEISAEPYLREYLADPNSPRCADPAWRFSRPLSASSAFATDVVALISGPTRPKPGLILLLSISDNLINHTQCRWYHIYIEYIVNFDLIRSCPFNRVISAPQTHGESAQLALIERFGSKISKRIYSSCLLKSGRFDLFCLRRSESISIKFKWAICSTIPDDLLGLFDYDLSTLVRSCDLLEPIWPHVSVWLATFDL